jgi:hypothetical protein
MLSPQQVAQFIEAPGALRHSAGMSWAFQASDG